jgi:serine/threonine-protein kinase
MPKKLGRYNIVRELGKGAMGIVYEGVDPTINRRVAIKTARRDVMEVGGRADEMMARFLREATAAGGLNHPNIITIYDAGEEGNMAYIAMEFLEGGDLFDLMERKRRFTPEEAVDIAATICDALALAHDQGIVHRDIKPANILIPDNAPLKIADFGIARIENSNLTQEGAMIGTPHYMSPEQFMGQRADSRSDLFSAGIILYEMLTGEKPFSGEALSTVMHNVIKGSPIEPRELNFAITDCLSKVVLKALSKHPQDRYQSGRAMAAALREALKPHPNPAVTLVKSDEGAGDAGATVLASSEAAETVVAGPGYDAEATGAKPKRRKTPAPAVSPAKRSRSPLAMPVMLIGGIVMLLVVAAGLAMLGRGGAGGGPGKPNGSGNTEPYFDSAQIRLYYADNTDAWSEANEIIAKTSKGGVPKLQGIVGLSMAPRGVVCLEIPKSQDPPLRVTVSAGIGSWSQLGKAWKELRAYEEKAPGEPVSFRAQQPGDTANVWLVVLKKEH